MAETAITELIPRDRPERESLGMPVSILVERAGSTDCATLTGQLCGATPRELTLLVAPLLDLDQVASLRIKIPQLQFDLVVAVSVCTTRAIDQFRCELTCTLDPELPADALARLAIDNPAPSSAQHRKTRSVRARASWAPDTPPFPVRIHSLVGIGLRMASTHMVQPGAQIVLHFDTPDGTSATVPAQMQWQLKTAERYLIGCALANRDDARSARQAIRWLETQRRGRSKTPPHTQPEGRQRWRDALTLATCAAVTAAAVVLLMASRPRASAMTGSSSETNSSPGGPVADLAETFSHLADQVAAHDRQLTDLNHTLQVAQTDGQAALRQTQSGWLDKQTEIANQLSRLDTSLNELDQRLGGIERMQKTVRQRQDAVAHQLSAAAARITALQRQPAAIAVPPAAARHAAAAAPATDSLESHAAAKRGTAPLPSATPRGNPHEPVAATATRTWTDATGTHQVAATLVGAVDGTARLKTASGRVLDIPIARLSQADQQFIASWMKKRPAK